MPESQPFKDDCIFCRIIKKEAPAHVVYEDEEFIGFLDLKPVTPGHTLFVPRTHYRDFFDMPKEVLSSFAVPLKRLAEAVVKATGADGWNLAQNNGRAARQIVFHVHFHIIPRKEGGKAFYGGERKELSEEENRSLAEAIKKALDTIPV